MRSGTILWSARAIAEPAAAPAGHRLVLTTGDRIRWSGADPERAPPHDRVEDLGDTWLLPGFVDAHVHGTATGLGRRGVDLSGVRSLAQLLSAVRAAAARRPGALIIGTGWDDSSWPERRPPTAGELGEAAPGCSVLLTRVDGHSCVVDRTTLGRLELDAVDAHVHRDDAGQATGWLLEDASALAYRSAIAGLSDRDLAAARSTTCAAALAVGITAFHEMGVPALGSRADALAWATGRWPLIVDGYWGELEIDPTGTLRPGGDLFLDGSIGSCTASTTVPYRCDAGGRTVGELFHDDADVAAFFAEATRRGVGAGVHAIGDRAIGQAVRAIEAAARTHGVAAVRAARHRVEHLELATDDHIARLARLGVVASLQPAFDAAWNGPGGLYEHRFGRAAADATNRVAAFAAAGMTIAFSSDSPVTPLDPWGTIMAAESHHGGHGVDRATALRAHTVGGHAAVRAEVVAGALVPGARADLVAWPHDPMTVTDASSMTPVAVVAGGRLRLDRR